MAREESGLLSLPGAEDPECGSSSASRPALRARGRILAGLAAVALVAPAAWSHRADLLSLRRRAVQGKWGQLGTLLQSPYAGAQDAYQFSCPSPLFSLVAAPSQAKDEKERCCANYRKLDAPMAFDECDDVVNASKCDTCKAPYVTDEMDLQSRPLTSLIGLAWAAAVDVKGEAVPSAPDMTAFVFNGYRAHISNICPKVDDWYPWVVQAFDEVGGVGCKTLKSEKRKLATVAFRGVDYEHLIDYMVLAEGPEATAQLLIEMEAVETDEKPVQIHQRMLAAANLVLPQLQSWVEGVGADYSLVFTGHGMGGAIATVAATLMRIQRWKREADAIIVFGAPKVSDASLGKYWEAQGMCASMMRMNIYNDIVPNMPLKTPFYQWPALTACVNDLGACLTEQQSMNVDEQVKPEFSDVWEHTCKNNEVLLPGGMRGINREMTEYNPTGGVIVHTMQNCRFGYAYGVQTLVAQFETQCGMSETDMICPEATCHSVEDLAGARCYGLAYNSQASSASLSMSAVITACEKLCCGDTFCEIWQVMGDKSCYVGRKQSGTYCDKTGIGGKSHSWEAVAGARVI